MDKMEIDIETLSRMYNSLENGGCIITGIKYDGNAIFIMKNNIFESQASLNNSRNIYVINIHPRDADYKHILAHEIGHIFSGHFVEDNLATAKKYNTSMYLWAINPVEVEADAFACKIMGDKIYAIFEGINARDYSSTLKYTISKALRTSFVWLYIHNKVVLQKIYSLLNKIIK